MFVIRSNNKYLKTFFEDKIPIVYYSMQWIDDIDNASKFEWIPTWIHEKLENITHDIIEVV